MTERAEGLWSRVQRFRKNVLFPLVLVALGPFGVPSAAQAQRLDDQISPPFVYVLPGGQPFTTRSNPQLRADLVRSYRQFVQAHHAAPEARPYPIMSTAEEDLGEVVVGAAVTDASGLPPVKTISWTPEAARPSVGRLVFHFDGMTRPVAPVLLEDVFAASALVFGIGDAPPMTEGEGVPLVALADQVPYFDCGESGFIHAGQRWKVVMHPALANTGLGWSILMVEVLPSIESTLLQLVRRLAGPDELKNAEELLGNRPDDWKISDVPWAVEADGEHLRVRRVVAGGEDFPEDLCRRAWIGINGVGDPANTAGFSADFYHLVPALTQASHDYQRVNDFFRVLALVRWAKAKGATFVDRTKPPPDVPTPASVITVEQGQPEEQGIVPAPAFERERALGELKQKIQDRVTALVATGGQSAKAIDGRYAAAFARAEQLHRSAEEAADALRKAEAKASGSDGSLDRLLKQAAPGIRDRFNRLKKEIDGLTADFEKAEAGSPEEATLKEQLKDKGDELDKLLTDSLPAMRSLFSAAEAASNRSLELGHDLDEARSQLGDGDSWREQLMESLPAATRDEVDRLIEEIGKLSTELGRSAGRLDTLDDRIEQEYDAAARSIPEAAPEVRTRFETIVREIGQATNPDPAAPAASNRPVSYKRWQELEAQRKDLLRPLRPDLPRLEKELVALEKVDSDRKLRMGVAKTKLDAVINQAFPHFDYWWQLRRKQAELAGLAEAL